jgi:hypothetical protein
MAHFITFSDLVEIFDEFILKATKGTTAEKRLACQFIPRFFKYTLALLAFNELSADKCINSLGKET